VVAVPLVGCVPLQPPDAAQVCASFAFHCNVARVPMTTLLLVATKVTAGIIPLPVAGLAVVWPDDDC
jgi:hypothetical protein